MVLLTLLFLQCNSSEKSSLCLLKTYTETGGAGTTTVTITYSSSRPTSMTRVQDGITYTTVFDYDAFGLLIGTTTISDAESRATNYFYDSQRKMIKSVEVSDAGTLTIDYIYNEHVQITTGFHTFIGPAGDYTLTETFVYANEVTMNPASITRAHSGGGTTVSTYLYDDKIYPLRGLLPSTRSVNNVVTETIDGVTRTYTYLYDANGYPRSATVSDGTALAWTYDCQEI